MPPSRDAYRNNRLEAAGAVCLTFVGVLALGYSACVIDPMGTGPLAKQTATTMTSTGTAGGTTTTSTGTSTSTTSTATTTSSGGMGGSTTSTGGGGSGGTTSTGGGGSGGGPVVVAGNVAASHQHTCAALTDGTARCWGDGDLSQLGNGADADSLSPVAVSTLTNMTQIVAGVSHSCGLQGGLAYCWGANDNGGVLGNNNAGTPSNVPVAVVNLSNVVEISAAMRHTCARLANGSVHCWGQGKTGQLGDGNGVDSPVPVAVAGLPSAAVALGAGDDHCCAALANGDAYCWGGDSQGQLGDGVKGGSTTTAGKVGVVSNVVGIAAHTTSTCAVVKGGSVYCWGRNNRGQLGVGNNDLYSANPQLVVGIAGAHQVAVGYLYACAVLTNGQASCWGANEYGKIGNGMVGGEYTTPQPILQTNVWQLDLGHSHSCAYLNDGAVRCWGRNNQGQLGTGDTLDSAVPISPQGL